MIQELIFDLEDNTFDKDIRDWDQFYQINTESTGSNPAAWNALAGPSNAENYVECVKSI